MKANRNSGFHVVEVLLIFAVVAVIGFVGWRVWQAQTSVQQPAQTAQNKSLEAPEVKNASDLDTASSTVDQVNLDASDNEMNDLTKDLDSL